MDEGVLVRYCWTLTELTEAARWHLRLSGMRRSFVVLWFLTVLSGALVVWLSLRAGHALQTFYCVAATLYLLLLPKLRPWLVLWQMRRNFSKSASRDAEIEWRITAAVLLAKGKHSSSELVWAAFIKAVLTPEGLLLYQQPMLFQWLPRHGFENEEGFEAVSAWARQNIPAFQELRR